MKAIAKSPASAPLAIVGISCIFPKAEDAAAYWRNIKEGVDAITEVPASHWDAADYFDADPAAPDRTYARRGGFLPAVDFDPLEWGVPPSALEAIDTAQLLALIVARRALDDAGYGGGEARRFDKSRASVILGVTGTLELVIPLGARLGHPLWRRALRAAGVDDRTADDVVRRISDSYVGWQEDSFPGLLGNVVAGRIANRLDLGGTNCVVDAACASSLSALHLAALELQSGRADLVISGGVDAFNDIFMYMCFSKTPALSKSGDARPFDRGGDGTILGEGLGMVVLKRLADAEQDGDRIYAVIRGLGTSSDGKGTAIYAPSAEGQRAALRRAYENAGISPATVELLEAHGTGTVVGDATEVRALAAEYRSARERGTWCALGSVKSQIGHTKAAAGVASLIKGALALYHKVLPPTIKVEQPIDAAAPGATPFYLNTSKRPWLARAAHPRRAAVSAFGFGGSNFHCVLEEHGAKKPAMDAGGDVQIAGFAAASAAELRAALGSMAEWRTWSEVRAGAHATRSAYRVGAPCRLFLVLARDGAAAPAEVAARAARLLDERGAAASWAAPEGIYFGAGRAAGKLAFVFPGQGSQYTGMLRDLACAFPAMQDALAAADTAFWESGEEGVEGARLSDAIYPHSVFGAEERERAESALRATEIAQPAIGAVSIGALRVLEGFGVSADAVCGHSFGELTAVCASGRLSEQTFHTLANFRGRLMGARRGDRGGMIAVSAPAALIADLLRAEELDLVIANKNAPDQVVLSGATPEIERALEIAAARGLRALRLPVAAAFHSEFVADAGRPFREALRKVRFAEERCAVFANT
ncbi:MAG: acyltransferase domain-containing protein, partial [Planctomycetes bacterium]|nr:acyltransferase domain-containing protein [Planctomycetota bacterium]